MIELCLWCTFRGYAAFDTFCVIAFSSYFATQFRLLCIDTNLVMLQNAEKLGVCKLTQGEGLQHLIGILGNFGCISVNHHRCKNLQQITRDPSFLYMLFTHSDCAK